MAWMREVRLPQGPRQGLRTQKSHAILVSAKGIVLLFFNKIAIVDDIQGGSCPKLFAAVWVEEEDGVCQGFTGSITGACSHVRAPDVS